MPACSFFFFFFLPFPPQEKVRKLTEERAKLTRDKKDLETRLASLQQEAAAMRETHSEERRTLLSRNEAAVREAQAKARDAEGELHEALSALRGLRDAIGTQFLEIVRSIPVEDRPEISATEDQLRYLSRELTRRGLQHESACRKIQAAEVSARQTTELARRARACAPCTGRA